MVRYELRIVFPLRRISWAGVEEEWKSGKRVNVRQFVTPEPLRAVEAAPLLKYLAYDLGLKVDVYRETEGMVDRNMRIDFNEIFSNSPIPNLR